MPMPTENETQDDFVSRCIPMVMEDGTAKDNEQAAAICLSMYRESKKAAGSLNETLEKIYRAFSAQFPVPPMEVPAPMSGGYVDEVYPDHVIVCAGEKYYKVPYSMDGDAVVFAPQAEWVEVVEEYVEKSANALKAISSDDNTLRVGNYIVLFGGRDLEGVASKRTNGDGSRGEYFSKGVDVSSPYTDAGTLYVDFEHGRDPDNLGIGADEVLGYVDWKTAKTDERGIFVERVLNRRSKYVKWLEELINAGLVGNSSEAIPEKVQKKSNGEIVRWPLRRDTLTVNPMEPRMLQSNQLEAIKSAYDHLGIEITPKAAIAGGDDPQIETHKQSTKENHEMDKEELKSVLAENNAALTATIEAKAAEAAKTAVAEAMKAFPEIGEGKNSLTITQAAEDREFKSVGENLQHVAQFITRGAMHPRVRGLQAKAIAMAKAEGDQAALEAAYKAALGSNEAIPSQGEFLLEPTLTSMFLEPLHETGAFSADVRRLPVGANSNSGWIPGIDETSRANGSRWGGVRSYHAAEAATMTASQPKFRRLTWELKKTYVLQYVTDELLADARLLTEIVNKSSAEELNFAINDDILNGVGGDRAQGVLQSPALISIARAATSAIGHADIVNMWSRMPSRNKARAKWYINGEVHPQLDALTFTSGSTGILSPYVGYTSDGVMTIYGRPVVETEFNAALGTAGDIVLADMTEYLMWEKAGIEAASSIHVQFLTDQTAFRFIHRNDGLTAWHSALTRYKGTATVSPFITLLATT